MADPDSSASASAISEDGEEGLFTEADAERLGSLIEAVVTTPYKYSNHEALLALLKKAGPGLDGELQEARQRMATLFLMDEAFWVDWLDDEARKRDEQAAASGVYDDDQTLQLLELHSRSVRDLLSVTLWKKYVEFVMKEYEREKTEGKDVALRMFDPATVDTVLVEAVNATNYCVPNSHEIWGIYRDTKLRDVEANPSPENIALLKRYYLARLRIPHAAINDTFSAYSTFITQYENDKYEKELVAANKIVAETRRTLRDLEPYEDHLAAEPADMNVWAQYIDVAIARPKRYFDKQLPKAIYERALANAPTAPAIWNNYVLFLLDQAFPFSLIDDVLERAVKACPKSGAIWAHLIRTRERFGSTAELIEETKDRAFATGLLDSNAEEYSLAAAAWLGYLRRRLENADLYADLVESVMADFEQKFPSQTRKDEKYILPQMYITSLTQQKKIAAAREQWESLRPKHARSSDFWLSWAAWEKSVCLAEGDIITPSSVLEAALGINNMDVPERICEAMLAFERDYGSAFSIEKAEIKIRKLMRTVMRRRALAASESHENKAPEKEEDLPEEKRVKRKVEAEEDMPAKKQKPDESGPARDREHLTVTVEGLPPATTEQLVTKFFQDCGPIKDTRLVAGEGSSTATIEFETPDGVLSAQTRDQKVIDGHTITVKVAVDSTLWVTNFPSTADEAYIRNLFSPFGELIDVRFPSLTVNNKRRFCYVQYVHAEDARSAQSALHDRPAPAMPNEEAKERKLIVKISDPAQRETRHGAVYEGRELFVRNIPVSVKEANLRTMFEKYGTIERIHLPSKDDLFHTHQGFGFVTFEKAEDAKKALELDLTKIGDRILNVEIAQVRKPAARGGHAGRGHARGRGRGGVYHPPRRI